MKKFAVAFLLALAALGQDVRIDIPYQKFVLPNGLTLIVHEDHKAPIVTVNIWYHVGSKNEKRGRTGFAHLFEHLMFNGSENYNQDYFKVLEKIGATDLNGTTNNDRTNYFQNVPVTALDTVLWMESDRMGHLLGAIDKARLDEQRGVVQNEKRQSENYPYGLVDNIVTENTYPAGHPYSWTVIGSMEDLNAASLDDVKEWFKTYYGPSNATLVIAGDINAKTAREKVEKYFGDIPPGPPIPKHRVWIAKRTGSHRATLEDRVPQARLYKVWNIPPQFDADYERLALVASILGDGKTSRLYKRLVYTDQLAADVSSNIDAREIGSQFYVTATARPGVELSRVEKAVDEEIGRLLRDGPTPDELQIAKTRFTANFLRGIERIGGFGGKSDALANAFVFTGDPAAYKKSVQIRQSATAPELRKAAADWLSDGVFTLEVAPFGDPKPLTTSVDRKHLPEAGQPPAPKMPKLQRATLSNGLKVVLSERHETPLVEFALMVNSGYAADQGNIQGTARLTMEMLDEGTKTRSSAQISEQLARLGAALNARAGIDNCYVNLSVLKSNLDPSLNLFADVILNPAFPETDFRRQQKLLLANIDQEKADPFMMALRVAPVLVYGKGHAYGIPLTGSGTEASINSITRDTLVKFHEAWFRPNNATLAIAGDTTLAEITPKLEKLFTGWKSAPVPKKNITAVAHQEKSTVYLMDRPGAMQSIIVASHVAPPKSDSDDIAMETMNSALGGMFISRLNMNLREDKHWSYGAGSFMLGTAAQRPFLAFAPVQTDKTKESVSEMLKELTMITRDKPLTAEELAMAQDNRTLTLAGSRETAGQVLQSMIEIVAFSLPDDYYDTYAGKVRALTERDMKTAAEKLVHSDKLVWIVIGDRAKVEAGLKELNVGPVKVIDPEGVPVQ